MISGLPSEQPGAVVPRRPYEHHSAAIGGGHSSNAVDVAVRVKKWLLRLAGYLVLWEHSLNLTLPHQGESRSSNRGSYLQPIATTNRTMALASRRAKAVMTRRFASWLFRRNPTLSTGLEGHPDNR